MIEKIAPLFAECNFPVYVYLPDSGEFYQLLADRPESKPVPTNMQEHLLDDSVFYQSFRKGDTFMYFYFLRLEAYGSKFVIMLNTDKERRKLNTLAKSIDGRMRSFEKELQADLDEANESVQILRKSRQKMLKLIDGLVMPLFSISPYYEIINVNKELANLIGISDIPSILNKTCYEAIHGRTEPCEFCRMAEILSGEETGGQTIELDFNDEHLHFEHHMFPIYSHTGEMDEIGEFMIDVSENYKNLEHIEKYKEKVKHIQKAEVDKMNEIGELKRAYMDLSKNYDEVFSRNKKMSRALEKLISDNNVSELVRLRQDARDSKNKLIRSATALKNFQHALETQQEKYSELSKKTVYQLERLINTVNKKNVVNDNDLKIVLKTVTEEIKELRANLKISPPPEES
ncbi:PAS domain-containing protein [Denitrovibrio acetiphilus]|nr:PAS domain-containing protein [Denitrovibrio acetiphilus]